MSDIAAMSAINNKQQIDAPSRKRRRTEDDELLEHECNLTAATASEHHDIVHDPVYYKDSGDCVLQVEDTLFKVHKAFLSQDSSAFVGMFSLPSSSVENVPVEGTSDGNPIFLYGDTVEQFRALLFVLYALPHQVEALVAAKVARLPELLAVAEITHKYHFIDLSAWCMRALKAVFHLNTVAPIHLERILRVAMLSNEGSLCAEMVSSLSTRLLDGTLPPTDILIIADRHHIHHLIGVAYYAQLMALEKTCSSSELTFPAGVSLNKDQRVRLLAGYWSLVRMWERLRDSPFQDSPPCSIHGSSCAYVLKLWRNYTSKVTMQFSLADVLGKMEALQNMIPNEITTQPSVTVYTSPTPPFNPVHLSAYAMLQNPSHVMQLPPGIQNPSHVMQLPPGIPNPSHVMQLPPAIPNQSHSSQGPPFVMQAPQSFQAFNSYASSAIPPCHSALSYAAQKIPNDIQASLQNYFSDRILGLDDE